MYQTREDVIQKLLAQTSSPNVDDHDGSEDDPSSRNGSSKPGTSGGGDDSSFGRRQNSSLIRYRQWDSTQKFVEDNLTEVYEKISTLEKEIWGKLIIMEGNRRTAKAYLRHPLITLDGSDAEFDGLRIGLSRFQNVDRSEVVYEIFNEILDGVKIKIDPDGNIWSKRMCMSPVFLKPLYRNRPNDLFLIDQRPVKVFDIKRFKEILVDELKQPHPDRSRLERCCLVCLKFSVDHFDLLSTPLWVIVVHLVAVELLNMVLPEDNDMSSPSSSFIGGAGSSPIPHQPPPIPSFGSNGSQGGMGTPMTPQRQFGRADRGGVVKRMMQQRNGGAGGDFMMFAAPPPPPQSSSPQQYPQQQQQLQLSDLQFPPSGRLPPSGYRSDFETRFKGQQQGGESGHGARSLLDLRQLNQHYAPVFFNRGSSSGGGHHQQQHLRSSTRGPLPPPPPPQNHHHHHVQHGGMGDRVMSLDALNNNNNNNNSSNNFNSSGGHNFDPNPYAQYLRHAGYDGKVSMGGNNFAEKLRKWKSQDSGIGFSGSYGSK